MNPVTADRNAVIKALNNTGLIVDDTQPEIIEPGTILFDGTTYAYGSRFGTITATHTLQVVLEAYDAQTATRAHDEAVNALYKALADTGAGDLDTVSALYNLQDAHGALYPAFTVTIQSTINIGG